MIVAETGGVRLEAGDEALLIHAAGPPDLWPKEWLTGPDWWRAVRELNAMGAESQIRYTDFWKLLREGFRLPLLFGGWSPLTIVIEVNSTPRWLHGEVEVEVERKGPYVRRNSSERVWLLDEPSWRLVETPSTDAALLRDLAVEANAQLHGRLADHEIVYGDLPDQTFATRRGWVERRFVDDWAGPVTPLAGRVGLRRQLPVRLKGSGRVLRRADYRGPETPILAGGSLSELPREQLQAAIAATFVWRGFHVVVPSPACWMEDSIVAFRGGMATLIHVLDECDEGVLRRVHQTMCRFRRACPASYTAGAVFRGVASRSARAAGLRAGIRVRDRHELASLLSLDGVPAGAIEWVRNSRCVSPGETVERLREAQMLP